MSIQITSVTMTNGKSSFTMPHDKKCNNEKELEMYRKFYRDLVGAKFIDFTYKQK